MTDYSELVKALRTTERICHDRMDGQVMLDAAAAIEELQQIADHYEQTAKDYWKEACEYKAQLSKRGEIVRCGECKHHEDEEPGMVYCPKIVGSWVSENWYCADSEREVQE